MQLQTSQQRFWFFMGGLALALLVLTALFLHYSTLRADRLHVEENKARAEQETVVAEAKRAEVKKQAEEAARLKAIEDARAAEMAQKDAAKKASAEHAKLLAKYVTVSYARKPGIKPIAAAVATENGTLNPTIAKVLGVRLQTNEVEILQTFLKPEFVSDGLINDAFAGSSELFQKLELADKLDALLLARQTVAYSTNPDLQNVLTATMQLEVVLVPVAENAPSGNWNFNAQGMGFTKAEARSAAEEHLIKEMAKDASLSIH